MVFHDAMNRELAVTYGRTWYDSNRADLDSGCLEWVEQTKVAQGQVSRRRTSCAGSEAGRSKADQGAPARQDHQCTGVKRVAKGREGRSGVTTRLAVLKARSGETEGLTLDHGAGANN